MRKLILVLALTALVVPGLSLAESLTTPSEPAPETPILSLEEIFLGEACPTEASFLSPPGCARPCKVNRDCRYYPEEICLNGCCTF